MRRSTPSTTRSGKPGASTRRTRRSGASWSWLTETACSETEPGYGQDYEGWLNALGKDPDMDTFALGKLIVDDFTAFYDKEEGDGSTQDGTLAVVDTEKLMASDFVKALIELDGLLNKSSEWFYYDEFRSLFACLEYGDMDYVDLGIHTDAQYYRSADGTMKFDAQGTSGLYIFFPKSDSAREAMDYYDMIGKILETMPAGDARTFLSNYRLTLLKYALVYYTGQAVTEMISQEEDKDAVEYGKGFDAVENYWKGDPEDEEAQEYNLWDFVIEPILDILIEAEGQEAMDEWMEINT